MAGLRHRDGDQPLPVPNDSPDVQSMVIADIGARRELGIQRYGVALQPFNGRRTIQDAYEECLDLVVYLRGEMAERDQLNAAVARLAVQLDAAQKALRRLSLNDEMAGMGQRDDDPEAVARCAYAKRALDEIEAIAAAGVR
jgi:hypothetical protein